MSNDYMSNFGWNGRCKSGRRCPDRPGGLYVSMSLCLYISMTTLSANSTMLASFPGACVRRGRFKRNSAFTSMSRHSNLAPLADKSPPFMYRLAD
ncbi:hypothetical protein BRPE64_DCDS08140 (plasmid) [Caballeronia insecticola]|uniref:Uncharacterized protein n=1 Tax=Caballeronia insecticola TaxID=758793 RepID=R4X0P3_9BURK|nr:hypothetical protein BRPE64_DCDS08140 [Caballeronia insecticola]